MEEAGNDQDRFPSLSKVLSAIQGHEDVEDTAVGRIHIELHASGDATYRVYPPRSDDPVSGYIAPEELA